MAALCPGVQYGLSSQESFGENKDLIFVKLTDSALRTIEEFLRNQSNCHTRPTIQFLGNEGHFSFPTQNGSTKFNFSVSRTTDMEGPGGSFECLQQTPRGSLAGLGPIPHKIRVAANDDVYDQTRQRMSVLEENAKNKSTREIEMNRTDIGRKVKVKQMPGRGIPPMRRETPPSAREPIGGAKPSSYPPTLPSINKPPPVVHNGNGLSNGLGSNHVSSSKPQNTKPSISDIARRPIKERMIHLLALRPYKKPELYDRLTREGLREKKVMMVVLNQIAHLKDNCYHLNRAMYNDVHEDWPFYNESERQILKRRKPENLTPPGSSDGGSSGSGHSPTSTHPGSPPPVTSSSKRPGYFDAADGGGVTKRQRISHFRKPSEQAYRSPVENNSQRRPMTDSRDASNMNPRSRESPTPPPATNGYHHHTSPPTVATPAVAKPSFNLSDDDDHHHHHPNPFSAAAPAVFPNQRKRALAPCDSHSNSLSTSPRDVFNGTGGGGGGGGGGGVASGGGSARPKVSSSTQGSGGFSQVVRVSPDSQSDRLPMSMSGDTGGSGKSWKKDDKATGPPHYLNEYTSIKDEQQRKRYKSDFNANYREYRELHVVVERVSQRFVYLQERLKSEDNSSPRYKDIEKQIVREYELSKKDCEHQMAKKRFQYLHDKLSHIKRLVNEYDQMMADSRY